MSEPMFIAWGLLDFLRKAASRSSSASVKVRSRENASMQYPRSADAGAGGTHVVFTEVSESIQFSRS